jgi:glycerate-2-kinase
MAVPAPGVTVADLGVVTGLLLGAGATITELNTVRTHLSAVGGGRLAVAGRPGRTVVLVVSDVVGDDLSVIGSAPFHRDATTYADALETLRRLDVWDRVPEAALRHLLAGAAGDRPENLRPDDGRLSSVEHRIVCRNLDACRAMIGAVEAQGYRGLLVGHALQGEARWLGVTHAGLALGVLADGVPLAPPCALVTGGETTVTVRGEGRGGRNQESCLAAVPWLEGHPITFLSAGTDGIDGNTLAAGAVVDGGSAARARAAGVDITRALRENDSGGALAAMGDALVTGPTGTNVADVRLLLIGGPSEGRAHG